MNSCLFECKVMHNRKTEIRHKFHYKYFMFYLDLDEIDLLNKKLFLFSHNRFNIFSFRDKDHLSFDKPGVKYNILKYLGEHNYAEKVTRIMLLTNVATLGYNFNPVSFYFCFDADDNPVCVVPEVGNTFGELKPYFISSEKLHENSFSDRIQKNFYVSPFIEHDVFFDFKLKVPSEKLSIRIDDYKENDRVFITSLFGKKKTLNNRNLLKYFLKYPFVTLKVITAIHFQALFLYLKKIRFFRKNEFLELQKGAIVKWKKQNI
jgi:uncharacterized protein